MPIFNFFQRVVNTHDLFNFGDSPFYCPALGAHLRLMLDTYYFAYNFLHIDQIRLKFGMNDPNR